MDSENSTPPGTIAAPRVPATVPHGQLGLYAAVEAERRAIKQRAEGVLGLKIEASHVNAPGEAIANLVLAFRHLEDASMRLGKALQALDGGASVYDRTQVPESAG